MERIIQIGADIQFRNETVYYDKTEIKQSTLTEFSNYFKKHSRVYLGVDKVVKLIQTSCLRNATSGSTRMTSRCPDTNFTSRRTII